MGTTFAFMERLFLENNKLSGTLPTDLSGLQSCTVMGLGTNKFSGNLHPLLTNKKLKLISIDDNNFNGNIPSELGSMTNLNNLKMTSNNFRGSIPSQIGSLTKLVNLELRSNFLTGSVPKTFSKLSNLGKK